MWYNESVFYQIYPMGFFGAPFENDGICQSRINKLVDWIPHIKKVGCNAIYFSPIFDSDSHGYDTRDYNKIDCRLGTNEDFKNVCKKLHENNIKVVLDGVFNHVGRGFWAFKDVLEKRENSQYKDWFYINFSGNNGYNDGLWYEGWEGHFELVKLNLQNNNVVEHLFSCIKNWINEFDIDGLRLDVAYSLDKEFLRRLRRFCDEQKTDFPLIGEMIHGDYNTIVNNEMLHSCTNYECYKGIYSSFNSNNMFEIAHSLLRQFGEENWTLYRGKHLFTFVDNHDVTRINSVLTNKNHLKAVFGLLFGMPGIPCLYYGSEWGALGEKSHGDNELRPCFDEPIFNDVTKEIEFYAQTRKKSKAICYGNFEKIHLTNHQFVFGRFFENEHAIIAINCAENDYNVRINKKCNCYIEQATGEVETFDNEINLPAYSVKMWISKD